MFAKKDRTVMTRTKFTPKILTRKPPGKPGRIGAFRPEMIHQVRWLTRLGATDRQIADFFQVDVSTIDNWKMHRMDFLAALKEGKQEADDKVQQTLFERAIGYEYDEESYTEGISPKGETYSYTRNVKKRVLPDVTAIIFWLKNRRPAEWKDVHKIESTNTVNQNINLDLSGLTKQQQQFLKQIGIKQLAAQHGVVSDN